MRNSRKQTLIFLFVRLLVWALMHTLYRMTVVGKKNIPQKGGALLVSNSVSYIDHALIFASMGRPVRFFMGREFYEHPLLNPLARVIRAIPVASNDSPRMIGEALREARESIKQGELVCIFAEGGVTFTGNMLPFGRGMEFIMRNLTAPIIPMHLDRIWGTTFSINNGKFSWHLPKVIPYPVTVTFGKQMPAFSKAGDVRLAVQELSADAFRLRGENQKKLHISFIDEAKRHPFKFCMADSLGTNLSYIKTLAGMITLSKALFPGAGAEEKDEKIGIFLPTSCASALVNGAVLLSGKIPVNLNYTSSKEIITTCEKQCSMKTVITSRAFLEKLSFPADENMIFLEDVRKNISRLSQLKYFLAAVLLPAALIKMLFVRGDKKSIDDVATVIFSSGSTGEPKGIMLTHQNISSNIESIYQIIALQGKDILMGILPFFHSFGFTAALWFPLESGVGVVYHTNPLDAQTVGEMVSKFKATLIMGTPTFFSAYQRKCAKEQFASLRFIVAGAEKLKQHIAESFFQKFNVPPFEGYGCSELSPVVSLGIPSYIHPAGKFVQVGNKPGTVGHPIPGVAAKIVHPETFEMLPVGKEGLLMIKGPNVMKGYLNDPVKTAEVIRDGWYVTGDIATIDEDGFIAIRDRLSRFSKIAGEMVPHVRIEDEIHLILGAPDQVCAVTALPDDKKGERLVVLYRGNVDVPGVWDELNKKDIPKLWIPKKECFVRIEEIPLLGSGKLDLKKLRQLAEQHFIRNDL